MRRALPLVWLIVLVTVPLWLEDQYILHTLIITGIFIIAAVITPGPDMASQMIVGFPMIGLYLISILIAWIFGRKTKRVELEEV